MVNGDEQIDLITEIRRHVSEIRHNEVADPGFEDLSLKNITLTLKTERPILLRVHPCAIQIIINCFLSFDPFELCIVQLGVHAAQSDQVLMRAALDDLAVLNDQDLVRGQNGGQAVCDQNGRP